MNESDGWLPWRQTALGKIACTTCKTWRKYILKKGIHWRYGKDKHNRTIVLINSILVTPAFVNQHYHSTKTPEGITPEEAKQLLKVYEGQIPDWLITLCKECNIPIPVAEDH